MKERKSEKDIRKIVILFLMMTVVMMPTAFAVYAERLDIDGVGTITGEWSIEVASISSTDIVGNAYNIEEPTFTATAVTFNTGLKSPGDSITYEVKVKNEGTINAVLNSINVNEQSDSFASKVIKYELLGDTQGTALPKKTFSTVHENTIKIRVYYDSTGVETTYDPVNTSKTITVALAYSQA